MRRGFTLIEMLIAMALTLILVYSVAEFYAYVGNVVRDGRATIELGGQLRAATQQLHDDLNSLTLRPQPWIDGGASPGYFTVYEGPCSDQRPDNGTTNLLAYTGGNTLIPDLVEGIATDTSGNPIAPAGATTLVGDGDDVIAFTIQSVKEPFRGSVWNAAQNQYVSISSEFAEVVWYTTFDDLDGDDVWDIDEPRFLCRRLLLILPSLGNLARPNNSLQEFVQNAEVSFHLNGNQPVANSLGDLQFRHNRFGCQAGTNYPSYLQWNPTRASTMTNYTFSGTKYGEDRVISNLLAFDVRVYDPGAPVYRSTNNNETAVAPGDPGFGTAQNGNTQLTNNNLISLGAFVDLSYNRTLPAGSGNSFFSGVPSTNFNLSAPSASPWTPYNFHCWDTWPLAYELPSDNNVTHFSGSNWPGTGRAFNGLDDTVSGSATNGVDDVGERQTAPPYAASLRGIQVRLRAYEVQTRQARQVTVGADFLQE